MQAANSSAASPSSEKRTKYKGVRRRKWGRWVSEIRLPNSRRRIWLGSFDTPEKAARAFDAAFVCLRGPGGGLNFPGSPPPDVGRTSDPKEVCAAAESHANRAAAPPPDDANATDCTLLEAAAAATALARPAPLQVSVPSFDWSQSQLLANNCLSPLFSPTTEVENLC